MNPLCLIRAVDRERKIRAPHRLKPFRRNVAPHKLRLSDSHTSIKDGFLPVGRNIVGNRLVAMGHHHRDLSAEMSFVEAERLFAVAAKVKMGL